MNAKTVAALCGIAAFAAAPAFAPAFAQGTTGNTQSNGSQGAANIGMTLKEDLTKAGFSNVQVMPEAYVVHAKDPHGHPVVMRVGPDSVTEVTELPTTPNTAQNGHGGTAGSGTTGSGATGSNSAAK